MRSDVERGARLAAEDWPTIPFPHRVSATLTLMLLLCWQTTPVKMATKQGKLGVDFWGNFYRVDRVKHTVEKLQEEVQTLGVQTALEQGGQTITLQELHCNMVKVKDHLRLKGFRVPVASDASVVCVWDLKPRSCNSSFLQAYLVGCAVCPESIKARYMKNVADGRTAAARLKKRTVDEIQAAASQEDELPSSHMRRSRKAADQGDLRSFSERQLTADEIKAVDIHMARFVYSEGLSFKSLSNKELKTAMRKLNASYADGSRLSDWTLRHHFLDDEFERVSGEACEKIIAALFVALISDGWSGVQKKHNLNIILATPEPIFMRNVETHEDSVTGEYQKDLFATVIEENGGIAKVPAICTDNASVMRKTWRLLRRRFHGLFTYGCAPHAFSLHGGDICKLAELSGSVANMAIVNNYFSKHLQANGLATLSRLQLEIYGKTSAPLKPGKTRKWNGQVACAEWHIANRAAMTRLVTDSEFDATSAAAKELKAVILDLNESFWPILPQLVAIMQPIRLAIHTLQGDYAKLSDVMGAFVRIYHGQVSRTRHASCHHLVTFSSHSRHILVTFSSPGCIHGVRGVLADGDDQGCHQRHLPEALPLSLSPCPPRHLCP